MDFGRAFSYVFEDEDWVSKVLLTAVIGLIPIVNFALFGWVIALMDNVVAGEEHPMPAWDNFGDKFTAGLMYFIASVVYNIPLLLVIGVLAGAGMLAGTRGGEVIGLVVGCGAAGLSVAYTVVALAVLFAGMVRYTRERELSTLLQFGENLRLAQDNLSTLVTLALYLILTGVIFSLFGWIPCIGWLAAVALGTPVYGHLLGQAAQQMLGKRKRGGLV